MYGKITLTDDEGRLEFVLNLDGQWTGSAARVSPIVDYLNTTFAVRTISPADGQPGGRQVNDAAAWLRRFKAVRNVKAVLPALDRSRPGTVY